MRALPAIMRRRPKAHFVIVGGDGEGYGAGAPGGRSWKSIFFDEVREKIDVDRLHFVGRIAHQNFIRLMQISTVHVYLTYPFVLSWSLLEAMSCGALIVASETPPVEEVIEDGVNGLLTPFFDVDALSDKVVEVLERPDLWTHMRLAARRTVLDRYDLKTKCLPEWLALIQQAAGC
jgi:glycosyltransferase involved in cell wall biosynthesis